MNNILLLYIIITCTADGNKISKFNIFMCSIMYTFWYKLYLQVHQYFICYSNLIKHINSFYYSYHRLIYL